MSEANKRSAPRINLKHVISIGNETSLDLVDIIDVSTEGIAFLTKNKLEKDSIAYLIFPGNDQFKENEIEATIWRCDPSGDPAKPFRVTAVLVDANLKYLEDIKKLVGKNS